MFQREKTTGGYLKELSESFKFRYMGLGFLWAWIYATWFTPVLFADSNGLTIHNDVSWLISLTAVALTLFVMPILLKDRDISSIGWICVLAGPATSVGAIMSATEPLFGFASDALTVVGSVITGVASGWLWMLWGEFTGKVEQELAELFVPLCVAVPLIILFTCTFVTGPLAGLAVCCLPGISGFLLLLSLEDESVIKPVPLLSDEERPKFAGDFVRVGIGSLAVYMCLSFAWGNLDYQSMTGWGGTHLFPYVLGAALAIAITTLSISYSTHLDLFGLYRWLIPVILFGLVFLSGQNFWSKSVSFTLITTAQYGFDIIVWIYFSRIVRKGVCSGSFALGINRGFVQAGILAGSLLAMATPRIIEYFGISLQLILLALSAVLTTVALIVLDRKDQLEHKTIGRPAPQNPASSLVDYDAVCSSLAAQNNLTAREQEILGYLARGRSLPYIREELILSKNTVDTHAKNLYRKLGVHSRQELLDLVEHSSAS